MDGYKIQSKEQFLNNILECSEELLKDTLDNKKDAYCYYEKKKKNGLRGIYAINKNHYLHRIQVNLQTSFFLNILFPECVCGFRKRKSYYSFLLPHVSNNNRRYYLRLDISDFFGSIQIDDIETALGYYFSEEMPIEDKEWVIKTIIDISTSDMKVIQGAVTSPTLSNLVFRFMDIRIERYCKKMGITYTRYADDMLFSSSSSYIHNYRFQNLINNIISEKGFTINKNKTLKFKDEISLNGYVIGRDIRLSRKKLKSLNRIIYDLKRSSFKGFSNRKNKYKTKNKLAGYRAFLIQSLPYLNKERSDQVKSKIKDIETLIKKYCC